MTTICLRFEKINLNIHVNVSTNFMRNNEV